MLICFVSAIVIVIVTVIVIVIVIVVVIVVVSAFVGFVCCFVPLSSVCHVKQMPFYCCCHYNDHNNNDNTKQGAILENKTVMNNQ